MVEVSTFVAVFFNGISKGILLAILGMGITLVFGMAEILNIAQGALAVAGALTLAVLVGNGFPLLAAVAASILLLAIVGWALDHSLLSQVYKSTGEERILLGIFVTLGLELTIQGVLLRVRGDDFSVSTGLGPLNLLGVTFTKISLITIIIGSIILAVVFAFLNRTYLGKALRTVAQDETGAHICGIKSGQMRTIAFVLSTVLAATAGILQVMIGSISVTGAFNLTSQALIVSVVGGVRNLEGTVIAGLVIGLVLTFASFFIGTSTALIITYLAAIAVLVLRTGL